MNLMDKDNWTIKEIEAMLCQNNVAEERIQTLKLDTRSTVTRLIKKWEKNRLEILRVKKLYVYEYEFMEKGCRFIAGVDEVGRGPLAGPVVVAAVMLPVGLHIPRINDSKKLSVKVREEIYDLILNQAVAVERAIIDEESIDCINIYQATVRGMYEVIHALDPKPEAVLIDAVPLENLEMPTRSLVKGDAISASIAAASIVAKVERDRIMDEFDKIYPVYGFAQHKGYGTAQHMTAIQKYGPCPIHRRSFEPIKSWGV